MSTVCDAAEMPTLCVSFAARNALLGPIGPAGPRRRRDRAGGTGDAGPAGPAAAGRQLAGLEVGRQQRAVLDLGGGHGVAPRSAVFTAPLRIWLVPTLFLASEAAA